MEIILFLRQSNICILYHTLAILLSNHQSLKGMILICAFFTHYINIKQMQGRDKREEFRNQIRKRQMQHIFSQIRKNKMGISYQFSDINPQIKAIMLEHIRKTVHHIVQYKKNGNMDLLRQKFIECIQSNDNQNCVFSACLNQYFQEMGSNLVDAVKKDIPESVLGELENEIGQTIHQQNMNIQSNFQEDVVVVDKAVELASQLELNKFDLQAAIVMIKILWNVFAEDYYLPHSQYPQTRQVTTRIMLNLCKALRNLLEKPSNHLVLKSHLKQMGLLQKLSTIIDVYDNIGYDQMKIILDLIFMFVRKVNRQPNSDDFGELGVHVIGVDAPQYDKFCALCLYFIQKGSNKTLLSSLNALEEIFNEAAYLIDSCQLKSIINIMKLILNQDRHLSVKSLELFNTIIFYSQSTADELVQKTDVLSIIEQRLKREQKMPKYDIGTEDSIQRCTNILCDILLSRNKKVKEKIFEHSIWQYLYSCIQQGHPLLGTIIVFNYLFDSFGRKRSMIILPSYLQAIANLNLQNQYSPYIREIREAIKTLYNRSLQFWQEDDCEQLLELIKSFNLIDILEEE